MTGLSIGLEAHDAAPRRAARSRQVNKEITAAHAAKMITQVPKSRCRTAEPIPANQARRSIGRRSRQWSRYIAWVLGMADWRSQVLVGVR